MAKDKNYNGPRSSFSLLPFPLRCKIILMLQDGATFQAVADDPEIAEEYKKRGLRLTSPAVSGIRKCAEYRELAAKRREKQLSIQADQFTTALLKDSCELETVSEQVKVTLLRLVQDCVKEKPEDTEEVERLVRMAVNLSKQEKDNQIAELKRQLREEKELRASEAETHKDEIAKLTASLSGKDAEIAGLRSGSGKKGVSEATMREVEQKIGML